MEPTILDFRMQISDLRAQDLAAVPGVRCQVSGVRKKNIEAETRWSEAEIPSEAKRQRGTLITETLEQNLKYTILNLKSF